MAIIKITSANGIGYGQETEGSFASHVKAKLGATDMSFESSSQNLKSMGAGKLSHNLDDSLGLARDILDGMGDGTSFESALADNSTGVASMAILGSVVGNASEYLKMLTNESVTLMGHADSVGSAHGTEYANVYSAESFDNQVLNEFAPISIALAYTTGVQSPGMEAIYRTVAMTPEQGGVDVKIPMLFTQNPLRHANDGSPSNFGFRRLIDADIDHRILEDNVTKIIPSVNSTTAANFVADSLVDPWIEKEGRREVETSALIVGKSVNLFGIGNLDTVSRAGDPNYTEALDRNIGVDKVFLNSGADTVAFKVLGVPFSRFVKGPEQNGKKLILSFPLSTMIVDKNTKNYKGEPLTTAGFTDIADAEYEVRLAVTVTGDVDVERGVVSINPGVVSVVSIKDELGNLIALDSSPGEDIVAGLANLKLVGWTPDARLTNSNQRHLGLMLNVRDITERLITKVRAPIWMPFPVAEDRDQAILEYLTVAVQKQKEKDGITQLIAYHERLMEQTGGMRGEMTPGDFEENALPYEGIGRYILNGYVQTVEIDLATTQSLDTNAKVLNGQQTLYNAMRSVWFDIMQTTNYENACRFVDGGQLTKPFHAALFGSDTVKRFLTVAGDTRTLGADVPHQIYSSVDARLKNTVDDVDTMYMVIVREGQDIDPLSAGVMLNTPSLVSTLTVTRDNAPRKEVVVQPRYAHFNLCPIIVKFEVKGVHALLNETLPFKTLETGEPVVVNIPDPVVPGP